MGDPEELVLGVDGCPGGGWIGALVRGRSSLSMQTWNITDRIAAVDEVLGDPADARVIEVHPEVSFRLLEAGIDAPKRTARGVGQRISALARFVDITEALADVSRGPGWTTAWTPALLHGRRNDG